MILQRRLRLVGVSGTFAGTLACAAVAQAQSPETRCGGEGEPMVLTGELQHVTVSEGGMCTIMDAHVSGNVTVEPDAMLMVSDSMIDGNVDVRPDSHLALISMEESTEIGGNLGLHEGGSLNTMMSEQQTIIGGNLSGVGLEMIQIFNTSIGGNVSFKETAPMTMNAICNETTVAGNTEIIASGDMAVWEIGTDMEDGGPCGNGDAGNDFGGMLLLQANQGNLDIDNNHVGRNLQVFSNTGGADVSDNDIEERLQCFSNDPPPTGGGNTAPTKEGQCEGF